MANTPSLKVSVRWVSDRCMARARPSSAEVRRRILRRAILTPGRAASGDARSCRGHGTTSILFSTLRTPGVAQAARAAASAS